MTTPDLRSLTSGTADFSEEIDEAGHAASAGAFTPGNVVDSNPEGLDNRGVLTIDRDLGPVDAAPKPRKGPAWRLQMLREWTPKKAAP